MAVIFIRAYQRAVNQFFCISNFLLMTIFAIFHALFMGCSYEREDGPVISFQTAQQAPRKVLGSLGGSEEGRNWEGDEQGIILGRLAC